ncbi:MAG: SIS domain-containing protein [bacterium]
MFDHVERLGTEFELAWHRSARMPDPGVSPKSVALAAMGGSASAADYFVGLIGDGRRIPIEVVRDYALPGYIGEGSLVAAVSYSGTTEEALACYAEARKRGASLFAITSGGELGAIAASNGDGYFIIDYSAPPRAALGHMLAAVLRMARLVGIADVSDGEVGAAARAHESLVAGLIGRHVPSTENRAKRIAGSITSECLPILLAAEHLIAPGRRARNQFSENAKRFAVFDEVPEATHNTVVGLDGAGKVKPVVLSLESPLYGDANARRFEVTARLLAESGVLHHRIMLSGQSRLADMFEATAWTDAVSCYLALLDGLDPTPTAKLMVVREAMTRTSFAG